MIAAVVQVLGDDMPRLCPATRISKLREWTCAGDVTCRKVHRMRANRYSDILTASVCHLVGRRAARSFAAVSQLSHVPREAVSGTSRA